MRIREDMMTLSQMSSENTKIVDDVLLYDTTIKDAFYHTYDYLVLCKENGITQNPDKFRFAKREVEFAGYCINWDGYRPSDNTLSAIRDFPMPESPTITDIRAWFGLVNQIAPFITRYEWMSPFRDLLKFSVSKAKKVYWDDNLQNIFERSRIALVKVATEGLAYYDITKRTAVVCDWSKVGIGFLLLQKHCECTDDSILCCSGGWKLAYCNDRFLDPAEENYAPIEGEALGVSWAMKKARMFLLGCKDFTVYVDHQPLVKVFNDKSLEKIENPRLRSLKEKTLQYSFNIKYIKGITNVAANAFSRYPTNMPDKEDIESALEINAVQIAQMHAKSKITSIDVEDIHSAAKTDAAYQMLFKKISTLSFAKTAHLEAVEIRDFFNVRDRLGISDGLITYAFESGMPRLVIPKCLRQQVIVNLHAANQGASSMTARARSSVYWPGLDRDISVHTSSCPQCRENAPSQTGEPLIPTASLMYPFQQVASDLFDIEGSYFLVYVDRLTGFPELAHFSQGTSSSNIINVLREFFHRWGVPEELSLDGAPNLTSLEIVDWLKSWKVNVRLSSAYYPQSNGRAEVGVKSMKRLLKGNLGRAGSIKTDGVAEALLQYRNTPLRGVDKSPAELALGRILRDTIPIQQARYKVDPQWYHNLRKRERSMAKSNKIMSLKHDNKKPLKELYVGDMVLCQNTRSLKWDRSGVIVEVGKFRQYSVKLDGSGRISLRNRKHLQKIVVTNEPPVNVADASVKHKQVSDGPSTTDVDNLMEKIIDPLLKVDHHNIKPAFDPAFTSKKGDTASSPVIPRRSLRETRKPRRYQDEYPG